MADRRRHKSFTDEEIKQKQKNSVPKSTVSCDRKWEKVLIDYLSNSGFESTEYWCYPDDEFDSMLVKFWLKCVRQL